MLIVCKHKFLQFIGANFKARSDQKGQVNLNKLKCNKTYYLLFFAVSSLIDKVAISESVLGQVDATEHIDGLFGVEALRNVDVYSSF